MAQIFPRWSNKAPLAVGVATPLILAMVVAGVWYWGSPKYTDVGYAPRQPLPFSHKRHAGELGMDCRYCHNTVEHGALAAVPPTQTCMNCHQLVLKESPLLEPVRRSAASGLPIPWVRVHMLPDFAYFDHSVHLAAGVGCQSCHGRIDQMKVVGQVEPLSMSWCLQCHRNPGPHLRPLAAITKMGWNAEKEQYDPARDPSRTRRLQPPTHCSGCHR